MKITRNLFLIIVVASQFCVASDKTGLNKPSQVIIDNGSTVIVTNVKKSNEKETNWVPKRFDALDHFVKVFVGADFHLRLARLLFWSGSTVLDLLASGQLDSEYCGTLAGITLGIGGLAYLMQNVPYYVYRFLRYGVEAILPKRLVKSVNERLSVWKQDYEIPIELAAIVFALYLGIRAKMSQSLYPNILAFLKNEPFPIY